MSKLWRRIAAGVAVVVILVVLAVTGWIARFKLSVPNYNGDAHLTGLSAPVQVLRDEHAIPHIYAKSRADALFALGYVQAQDRLWQMVFLRAVMQGRLAELVGQDGVSTDILFRTLGLYRSAEQSVAHLNPDTRHLLDAYAAGVNAFIAKHKGPLPIEFSLFDVKPDPWKPADSLAVLKYMQFDLSENMFNELARARLATHLSKRQVEDLFPPYPGDAKIPLPGYISMFSQPKAAASEKPDTTESNNWVVAGFRSVTGAPLLANDPHLSLTIPGIWYLAHLSWPGHDLVGGVLPGFPAVAVGRSRTMAWGATNTGPDTQDIYIEKLATDGKSYVAPNGTEPFRKRQERIAVRFGKPVTITVRATRHGPVLPEEWPRITGLAPKHYVLALAWTAMTSDDRTIQANLAMNDLAGPEDLRKIVPDYISPMQNIVFADKKHIGLMMASRIPVRDAANDSFGLVPAKGWDARYDWKAYVPNDQLPRIDDPASGQIATANNKTVPPDYPHVLTYDWDNPYRFQEADKLLRETQKHSVESFRLIQLDTHDRYAEDVVPLLLKATPWPSTQAAEAAAMLGKWDYAMDANRPEPLIFEAWHRALVKRIIADELGDDFKASWSHHERFVLNVLNNVDGEARWCDDVTTKPHEDCASRIRRALTDALSELQKQYGNDMHAWRWGAAHHAVFTHAPLGQIPLLSDIFDREVEASGGEDTLRRASFRYSAARPYAAIHGSGYRAIYDLANPDASLFVISTGESGNVFSRYYDDQIVLWAAGNYYRIPTTRNAVEAITKYRMTLQPESASAP